MSPEIQLVLIGGLIAILSSISTAVITSLLAYWLENRRERRKLKIEVGKSIGRYVGIAKIGDWENKERNKETDELLKELSKDDGSLEELAATQGMIDILIELFNKAIEK